VLGGQSGITGHITIGDQAKVSGRSGVSKNVPPKAELRGSPAIDFKTALAQEIAVRRLGATQITVKQLEERIAELERRLAEPRP
jgi:UDP-3-O-[3-hydroxymyristoyl] glucosamine N-acyltransferase